MYRSIPLRMGLYILMLYDQLYRQSRRGLLPNVFPLLLYSGRKKWTIPLNLRDFVAGNIPARFIPNFEYYPILIKNIPYDTIERLDNLVAAVASMEQQDDEEGIRQALEKVFDFIRREYILEVRTFIVWLIRMFRVYHQVHGTLQGSCGEESGEATNRNQVISAGPHHARGKLRVQSARQGQKEASMLVQEIMTKNVLTTTAGTSVTDALSLMREKNVRRLPVLDKSGKLVGIVSDKDLLYASPSPATSLSVFEINGLLSKIFVSHVMSAKVLTIAEDLPVEDAARIMADKKIGGLPVMKGGKLIGIVTETDLFRALLQLFGGRRSGVRVTIRTPGTKGTFAKVTGIVSAAGGDIVGLGVVEAQGVPGDLWNVTLKVQDLTRKAVSAAFAKAGLEVVDIRETKE